MEYERDTKTLVLGDMITVQTLRGVKGNIVGRLLDGRMVLFNRDSPYMSMLAPDQSVDCSVNYVSERYVIVDPIREPKPIERLEPEEPDLSEKLRRLSEEGAWETAIFARALIHIIGMFDALKAKPPEGAGWIRRHRPVHRLLRRGLGPRTQGVRNRVLCLHRDSFVAQATQSNRGTV